MEFFLGPASAEPVRIEARLGDQLVELTSVYTRSFGSGRDHALGLLEPVSDEPLLQVKPKGLFHFFELFPTGRDSRPQLGGLDGRKS